jgi:hypothetical protein
MEKQGLIFLRKNLKLSGANDPRQNDKQKR